MDGGELPVDGGGGGGAPVGGLGTHWPFCSSWSPLQIGGVGVGVPEPPVGVLGTHAPLLKVSVS